MKGGIVIPTTRIKFTTLTCIMVRVTVSLNQRMVKTIIISIRAHMAQTISIRTRMGTIRTVIITILVLIATLTQMLILDLNKQQELTLKDKTRQQVHLTAIRAKRASRAQKLSKMIIHTVFTLLLWML